MYQALRIILALDSSEDANLVLNLLAEEISEEIISKRITNTTTLLASLKEKAWDVIIADYQHLLSYLNLLPLLQTNNLDLPVILICDEIGTESTVMALKAGANDVVTKTNIHRLPESIKQSLQEAKIQKQRKGIQQEKLQLEARYQGLFENAVVGIFQTTMDGNYINANLALAKIYGYKSVVDMMLNISDIQQQLYVNPKRRYEFADLMRVNDYVENFESQIYRQDGSIIWIKENAHAVRDESGNLLYYEGFVEDINERHNHEIILNQKKLELEIKYQQRTFELQKTNKRLQQEISERHQAELVLAGQNHILEMILQDMPLKELLEAIAIVIENLSGEMKCSFLLLDPKESSLHVGAAPSLPKGYNQAIDGIKITSPHSCSCTKAAYDGEAVIVEDISKDPLFENTSNLALDYGLQACWSMPILTKNGEVLGVFAMYYEQPHSPSDYEKELIIKATHLVTIAIEKDRTQNELKEAQTRLKQLSANVPGVIYQLLTKSDGSFSFPFMSPSCYSIYELTREEIYENPQCLFDLINEHDVYKLHESIAQSIVTLKPLTWEGKITTPSGKERWIRGESRPERQSNGDTLWDGVVIDITESKKNQAALENSEAKLRQKAEELEQALYQLQKTQIQLVHREKLSSLGQLVAGIAHEINNPVNFIYNNLSFIQGYTEDILILIDLYKQNYPHASTEILNKIQEIDLDFIKEDLPKMLSSMKLGTDRIYEIILSLRTFSRGDQITAQFVDIHKIIDSVLLILKHRLKSSGRKPTIEVIKNYGDLPFVKGYPGQLNQVFMNIIANAIDALEVEYLNLSASNEDVSQVTLTSPTISISTFIENNFILIKIQDNGPGMTEEEQQQIFNTFYTTKAFDKGTGLGLSISHEIIVEKHRGQLNCISTVGIGTDFYIYLPISEV
jgi:PAS domain S-box-containing protein